MSEGLDCFGLVRHALYHQFNGPLLESFCGVFQKNSEGMDNGFNKSVGSFEHCPPQAGALACCFRKVATKDGFKDVFHHIGICIDAGNVMHTLAKHGCSVVPVRTFNRLSNKVEFYKYVAF